MTRHAGFSLLEVLAALALLATLLLGVYAGVSSSSMAVRRGTAVIDRLDAVRGAREFLRRELSEAAALPWVLDKNEVPVVFDGSPDRLRFVAPLPGYLGKQGMQVITVKIVVGKEGDQRVEVMFAPLPTSAGALPSMDPEPLVEGMHGLSFRFVDKDGARMEHWRERSQLPALIEIRAEGKDEAAWPVLAVSPRQSPWALEPGAIGRVLGKEDPNEP
ncbi:prepilin-type N-terminal cleavage/methylation domain-containing protein [Luteibacter pinisoli]|uniref:Prepilin-type N-terminal cleavage/methylation domain-containing protein n=1 Tax=Luteibacter pinisoli TaxID=2589080 RepID=A0A4Y5Z4G8_9GAMM|nr:prepilin-type N-terminal cleavage/methylation domain-containing protein [Luteibacter pinisoli]QDE40004.1 prepilin-type N-terminal cleavage/methylation domain-containing protein [Luteibacter pinisoli]